jgi:hypothetical protein
MYSKPLLVLPRILVRLVLLIVLLIFLLSQNYAPGATVLSAPTTSPAHRAAIVHAASPLTPPCGTLNATPLSHVDTLAGWEVVAGTDSLSTTMIAVPGYDGQAVQLKYHLRTQGSAENWVQLKYVLPQPVLLPSGAHLRFFHRGTAINALQVGLITAQGNYFSFDMKNVTHTPWWTYVTWDVRGLKRGDQLFDFSIPITAVFISVKKINEDGVGGLGSFTVDELQYLDMAKRPVPVHFEPLTATTTTTVTQQAAAWIASQQYTATGLLRSWKEEAVDNAWLYDQALGLLVLSEAGYTIEATRLANRLHTLQNQDGSWYEGYQYLTAKPITKTVEMTITTVTTPTAVGAQAWAIYALARYAAKQVSLQAYQDARAGANWLAELQRSDGSLPAAPSEAGAPTEPNLDAWWAFKAAGYQAQAYQVQRFLLSEQPNRYVWDGALGRFRASPDAASAGSYAIFLDNQTWGAAFLRAVGRDTDARRALSYARWTLATTFNGGTSCGFDGAGPFAIWNEGTLQYVAVQGENSQYYWNEMVRQQESDGSLPGAPDGFEGYTVWLTRWHGIAPTAWLYFAGTSGPFNRIPSFVFLPGIEKS